MTKLDQLYLDFLKFGFVVLRQASDANDAGWVSIELELLHNVPSLIGETNHSRHVYFWTQERKAYLDWVALPGRDVPRSRMTTFYKPIWDEMAPLIEGA